MRRARDLAILPALVAVAGCSNGADPSTPRALTVITGALPLYHTRMSPSGRTSPQNDASGAAFIPGAQSVLLVDDGGDSPPDTMPFYLVELNANFRLTPLVPEVIQKHGAVEGAAFDGSRAYVTSSLDGGLEGDRFHSVSRFRIEGTDVLDAETMHPRETLLDALASAGSQSWFQRIKDLPGKEGGLAVEGLSVGASPGEILFGLRSPLAGETFPGETRSGLAIVLKVQATTFRSEDLRPTVHTVDLGGLGIRSMEYSATARGHFIIAGMVEPQPRPEHRPPFFELYFWRSTATSAIRVPLEQFGQLCRPEGLAEVVVRNKKYLMIISEESGALCEDPPRPFNYLLVEIDRAFLGLLGP